MTRSRPNSENQQPRKDPSEVYSGLGPQSSELTPRNNSEAVRAGLNFLFSSRQDRHWQDFGPSADEPGTWVTAYVLARIGELPPTCINAGTRRQVADALDWLLEARSPAGVWSYNSGSEDDADSTGWAVLALRRNGREVPAAALEFIQRCRRADGGIAPYPEESVRGKTWKLSAPDVTAVGANAVGGADTAAANFLSSCWLQTNKPLPPSRLASQLFTCAAVMDWDAGLAPWALLDKVCELMSENNNERAFEQALLLRCLTQLRMQKAWSVAATLRRMQHSDGGWPASAFLRSPGSIGFSETNSLGLDHERILTTATAISALAKGEDQPGLYFGSDRPLPRKLYNT
jgi:hypothetical protein